MLDDKFSSKRLQIFVVYEVLSVRNN